MAGRELIGTIGRRLRAAVRRLSKLSITALVVFVLPVVPVLRDVIERMIARH